MSTRRQSVGIKKQAEELEERTSLILSFNLKSQLLDGTLTWGGSASSLILRTPCFSHFLGTNPVLI